MLAHLSLKFRTKNSTSVSRTLHARCTIYPIVIFPFNNFILHQLIQGTAVAQWLRHCATNRKVAGSIPAGVSGFFIDKKILPIALLPWGRLSL